MTSKIQIIDIDLGINTIVNDGVQQLSTASRAALDHAVSVSKLINSERIAQLEAERKKSERLNSLMDTAYNELIEKANVGLPVYYVLSIVKEVIVNSGVLTTRLKKMLVDKGNPYILKRRSIAGQPHYVFETIHTDPN